MIYILPIKLIEKIFSASNIQRWNDHIKATELTEIDKQSHKAILAFILAKLEEDSGKKVDYTKLIEGMIFELLQRIELTDLRPNIYHKIMRKKEKELNSWVLNNLKNMLKIGNYNLYDNFERYLMNSNYAKFEKKILNGAHYLATYWEFKHIYNINSFLYGIEETKSEIEKKLEEYYEIEGVKTLILNKKLSGFTSICGQLRFQQRWAQSPRIPKTTVLGHMFFVAILSYFVSKLNDSCEKKIYNNFFTALFHDLPEVLTRDIISPIKKSVKGLEKIIKECEEEEMNSKIYPLLTPTIKNELKFFTEQEFENRIFKSGKVISGISDQEMLDIYNNDNIKAVDGKLLKACDNLAAFIEANMSIRYGISSENLFSARTRLYEIYKNKSIMKVNFSEIFTYFYGRGVKYDGY